MSTNKTTFSISSQSGSDMISIGTPLNVSYLIDEKYTVDNTSGVVYPNFAIIHKNIYSTVSKIDSLLNNDVEQPVYRLWNWNEWYSSGSLVYTYDETTLYYKFYKAVKMTNPLISLNNVNYWNDYVSPVWQTGYLYIKGTIVHVYADGLYSFYESLKDVGETIEITNLEYWRPINLNTWSYDSKYNIGTKIHSGATIYTCIKTVLPVTKIDNKEYWVPFFDYYALIKSSEVSSELKASLEALAVHVAELKLKFELDMSTYTDAEVALVYSEMEALNTLIQNDWLSSKTTYNGITKEVNSTYAIIWRNMYDANIYFNELNLYVVDPIKVLESIKYLDSFSDLLVEAENKSIVAYVNNLYLQQDPAQKNGAYFIYDINKKRFIKALLGQHDHRNKDILDEITQSFDEISETDNISTKVLTIRKEISEGMGGLSWDFHPQWKDIDVIPDKPTDGKEYILKVGSDGDIAWSDKLSSSIAFVKKEKSLISDQSSVDFDVDLSFDDQGVIIDSILLFKNSLYVSNLVSVYDQNAKILTVSLTGGELFNEGDLLTLILIRNTSAEMLSKLSDEYVSKKEAIEILSSGTINLRDYAKKESLYRYSLRNHIHTRYAARDHAHWGVYADYYHNHNGLYMTRDDVNQILGNILSINPDLIDIISSIASDLETLQETFVAKAIYDQYISDTNARLNDLEVIDENQLYINPNTGEVSKRVVVGESISFIPTNINSYQIETKYKISDDPEETVLYNLEDWLDHVLDLIQTEELRIKKVYQETMKADKVIKTYTLLSNDSDGIDVDKFAITGIKLSISEPFDSPISIYLDDSIMIEDYEIIENEASVVNYDINMNITTEKNISFDLGIATTGIAVLIITGYAI